MTGALRSGIALADNEATAFLNAAPDAMVIADAAGFIVLANAQAQKLFGYSSDELIGRPIETLLPERFRGHHVAHRAGYFHSPLPRPMGVGLELFALRKDGTEFPAEVGLSPVRTRHGMFVSSAIRDISERKAVELMLIEARQEAERLNRAKSAFLAAASHDLRQPLQTLTLLNGVLSRAVPDTCTARAAVANQAEALRAMSNLLNSLLDISQLEAGRVKPDITDCSVPKIFERLQAEFAAVADAKGLELIVEACSGVVRTDPTLLTQIIQNLIANAIRYTRQGHIRLRCLGKAAAIRIEVLDTGVGIPATELEMIFEEFYQVSRERGQSREGLGLGLSIVRRLTELLGHPLEVESSVGAGSCFAINVPRGKEPDTRKAPPLARTTGAASVGGIVLVVDDEGAVAEATAMLLRIMGHEVMVARNCEQAKKQLLDGARQPSLVICDYHLDRGETGVDAIQTIRDLFRLKIPAILVSGDTSSSVTESLQRIDDCRLLSKPVDADELLALIDSSLQPTSA